MVEKPVGSVSAPSQSSEIVHHPRSISEFDTRLSERLQIVARGNGLDRVEDAICKVSELIANRADSSMSEKGLQTAVGAIAGLAYAMERIVKSRAMVSIAHRSYAEGDKLLAEAERDCAEANKLQAETAMLVEKRGSNAASKTHDPGTDALAILRGTDSESMRQRAERQTKTMPLTTPVKQEGREA